MSNKAKSPGSCVIRRSELASIAVDQLVSWINDQLPKKYVGKEVYLCEMKAPNIYTFRQIYMTTKIRDRVKCIFQKAGWKVRYENAQWYFNAPQNIDTPDLM